MRGEEFKSRVVENIGKVIVGKNNIITLLLTAILAEGHVLLEDVPGTGKTKVAKSLAKSMDVEFSRVQFTPDLLPTDITGLKIYDQKRLAHIVIASTQKQEVQKNMTHTEYHDGTQTKRVTYTYSNGKMNGIYREYDTQGVQTIEMPVVNDKPNGNGWILENGIRTHKKFYNHSVLKVKERD